MSDTRFTIYTPVWDDEDNRFKQWLSIGDGWRDDRGEMRGVILTMPVNPDQNFTGYIRFVEAGTPPPEPLKVTRAEFMATAYAASERGV